MTNQMLIISTSNQYFDKITNDAQSIYPLLRSHCTCGSLYRHTTSAFSGSISHGTIITTLPGRIHTLFLSLPGILHILVMPSRHLTRMWLAPSMVSTVPSISRSFSRGVLMRVYGVAGSFLCFRLSPSWM